jgi:hypothetical protein
LAAHVRRALDEVVCRRSRTGMHGIPLADALHWRRRSVRRSVAIVTFDARLSGPLALGFAVIARKVQPALARPGQPGGDRVSFGRSRQAGLPVRKSPVVAARL